MKLLLALSLPLPLVAATVPVELGIALVLLGAILAAIFPLISERLRRRRIERDIALFFERRHRRTYCTRL
jgi:hypothetical protein